MLFPFYFWVITAMFDFLQTQTSDSILTNL